MSNTIQNVSHFHSCGSLGLRPLALGSSVIPSSAQTIGRNPGVLRERSRKAQINGMEEDFVVDIAGTGGDGNNLFNVSTTAAIVTAGCKSHQGSANLLQALGCIFVADGGRRRRRKSDQDEDYALPSHPLVSVAGGSPVDNSKTFKDILDHLDIVGSSSWHSAEGEGGKVPANLEPVLHFTLMNASALLVVAGVAKTFKEGVRLMEESVRSGKTWEAFGMFRDVGVKKANDRV
ncbi:hypothetical protein K435DRAFT_798965 [Dendrothele bispora CBS 962.96]|uniref:Glycosyl transferase family 3 domain-containing protein n=1 Tax=Dendrothele bispora (strain CBS 962.96) TaxID=1314807 RepID=A0A4S8LXT4_DENBC|nr:hypothetical protein K435DRAFT_798965 [Dendrothele bispora CBS 962.96]